MTEAAAGYPQDGTTTSDKYSAPPGILLGNIPEYTNILYSRYILRVTSVRAGPVV